MEQMEFNVIAKLIRSRDPAKVGAHMVLVGGLSGVDAAKGAMTSPASVSNTIQRFRAADKMIREAYGFSGSKELKFEAIAYLIRSREPAKDGARMVFINGLSGVEASHKVGISTSSISNTLQRFRRADESIRHAYGFLEGKYDFQK